MRKVILFILPLLLISIAYLYYAYVRIYYIIGKEDLKSPYKETRIILENPNQLGSVKYVSLGDSLGAGVGSKKIEETYPYLYAKKLLNQYQRVELVNLAYPGDKTVDVINNQLLRALQENPDYITLLVGTNDLHNHVTEKHFRDNYQNILNILLTGTSAKIIVINLPYLASNKLAYPPYNLALDYRTQRFNKIISEISNNSRIQIVDLYSLARMTGDYYSSDYFHPSGKGYILWSQFINAD